MENRKAFNFYRSYYEIALELPRAAQREYLMALLHFQFTGEEPELKGMAKFALMSQKHSIIRQLEGYKHGQKGGAPPKGTVNPPPKGTDNHAPKGFENQVQGEGQGQVQEEGEGQGGKSKGQKNEDINYLWNTMCSPPLPKVEKLTNSRKAKIKTRLSEMGNDTEKLKEVFQKIKKSPFLTGENDRSWKATFDWIMDNDSNWVKVIEGVYTDSEKTQTDKNPFQAHLDRINEKRIKP